MEDKIILNSMIRSTTNKFLWYYLLSFHYDKAEGDYLIEYNQAYEKVNGEKTIENKFIFKTYLSDFSGTECDTIYNMIMEKLKVKKEPKRTLIASPIYI